MLAKGNMFLATATLRLDFANSIVNMISTPIMIGTEVSSLRRMVQGDSALARAFQETMRVAGPGGRVMPSTTKLLAGSINNFFGLASRNCLIGTSVSVQLKRLASCTMKF